VRTVIAAVLVSVMLFAVSAVSVFAVENVEESESVVSILDVKVLTTPPTIEVVGSKLWPEGIKQIERTLVLSTNPYLAIKGFVAETEEGKIVALRGHGIEFFGGPVQIVPSKCEDGNDLINTICFVGAGVCPKKTINELKPKIVERIPGEEMTPGTFLVITGIVIPPPPEEEVVETPDEILEVIPTVPELFSIPPGLPDGDYLDLTFWGIWSSSNDRPAVRPDMPLVYNFSDSKLPPRNYNGIEFYRKEWRSGSQPDSLRMMAIHREETVILGNTTLTGVLLFSLQQHSVSLIEDESDLPWVNLSTPKGSPDLLKARLTRRAGKWYWVRLDNPLDEGT